MVRATEQHTTSDAHLWLRAREKVLLSFYECKEPNLLGVGGWVGGKRGEVDRYLPSSFLPVR